VAEEELGSERCYELKNDAQALLDLMTPAKRYHGLVSHEGGVLQVRRGAAAL